MDSFLETMALVLEKEEGVFVVTKYNERSCFNHYASS